MRPEVNSPEDEIYECAGCGKRVTAPADRECEGCGGDLRNLSVERDL